MRRVDRAYFQLSRSTPLNTLTRSMDASAAMAYLDARDSSSFCARTADFRLRPSTSSAPSEAGTVARITSVSFHEK